VSFDLSSIGPCTIEVQFLVACVHAVMVWVRLYLTLELINKLNGGSLLVARRGIVADLNNRIEFR
jgi:hypothetical protein